MDRKEQKCHHLEIFQQEINGADRSDTTGGIYDDRQQG